MHVSTRIRYLATSCFHQCTRARFLCPSCQSAKSELIERKWLVTSLRRCSKCQLLFRTPTTTSAENRLFYQEEYTQGTMTDTPSQERLEGLKKAGFKGSDRDFAFPLEVLAALGAKRGQRVFDYGCSWGYGSWQFANAGFDVTGFEISERRAIYASENLGVRVSRPDEERPETYDIFFSSHVIEHVPNARAMLLAGLRLLRPGGLFVCFTPNGSETHRRRNPTGYAKSWGLKHPQLICEKWIAHSASRLPWVASTTPHDLGILKSWARAQQVAIGDLGGGELLFAVRKQ